VWTVTSLARLATAPGSVIPEPLLRAESTSGKFLLMFFAIALFAAIFAAVLGISALFKGRSGEKVQGVFFVGPAILLLLVGLVYPAILTINQSFRGTSGEGSLTMSNYVAMFTEPELLIVLRNTAIWVILVPFLATAVGLLYAILIDRARVESFAKALIFLPMAISMVGASIIWRFVYAYKPTERPQIGLLNEVLKIFGFETRQWLLDAPLNTLMLIIVMIWIQAGFAMTVLSAAIKAIPDDIIEAAKLDGVNGLKMFRFVTLPSVRPALVVVLTTIGISTLKVFDIVRTMTNGNYQTSIVALEFYNQTFRYNAPGIGAALAVLLFVLVVPIVVYNIIQMRKDA
jgi:alpha-glucoside transport system permease protein